MACEALRPAMRWHSPPPSNNLPSFLDATNMQHGIVKSASTRKIRLAVSDGSGNCLAHGPDCGETTDFLVEIKGEEWSYGVYAPQRHILGGTPSSTSKASNNAGALSLSILRGIFVVGSLAARRRQSSTDLRTCGT